MQNHQFEQATKVNLQAFRAANNYTLNHLIEHLLDAGRPGQAERLLIGNSAWMQAKNDRLKNNSSFIVDMELFMGDLPNDLSADGIIRLIQCHAALQTVAQSERVYSDEDLEMLVQLGREAEALTHVHLRANLHDQINGLLIMDKALRSKGHPQHDLLEQAIKLVSQLRPDSTEKVEAGRDFARLASRLFDADKSQEASAWLQEAINIWEYCDGRYEKTEVDLLRIPLGMALAKSKQPSLIPQLFKEAYDVTPILVACIEAGRDEIINTNLSDRGIEVPLIQAYAKAGRPEKARELASRITDGGIKGTALCSVAVAFFQKAAYAEARSILTEAELCVRSKKNSQPVDLMQYEIADAYIALLDAMIRTGHSRRAGALVAEVEECIQQCFDASIRRPAGLVDNKIEEKKYHVMKTDATLRKMKIQLNLLITQGKLEAANSLFDRIMEVTKQFAMLKLENQDGFRLQLVEVLTESGLYEDANRLIEQIDDNTGAKRIAIRAVACSLAEAGQADLAYAALKAFEQRERYTLEPLARISIQARTGRISEAIDNAEALTIDDRDSALYDLITVLINKSAFADAQTLIPKLKHHQSQALRDCILALAHAGSIDEALEMLKVFSPGSGLFVKDDLVKAETLAQLSRILKTNHDPRIEKVISLSQDFAQLIQYHSNGMLSMSGHGSGGSITEDTAENLAALEHFDEALTWLHRVPPRTYDRSHTQFGLDQLVTRMAQAGEFERALNLLGEVELEEPRQKLRRSIAEAMMESHQFEPALKLLRDCSVEDFLGAIIKKRGVFDGLIEGFSFIVLTQTLRILGWTSTFWYGIYELFSNANKSDG